MSIALPPTLTGEDIEAFVAMHGAEQMAADAHEPNFTMPPQLPLALPPPLPKPLAQNFIARHWRGELSLPRAFWINCVLLSIVAAVAFGAVGLAIHPGEHPVFWLIWFGLTWSTNILFDIWGTIGVWRAATAYRQSGKRFWGIAAKVMMVLSLLHLGYSFLFVAIPQGLGIVEIVGGDKRLGSHQFKVLSNGTVLDFSGGISFGTAKEFESMLKAMDNVTTVRLNSNGGRIAEAQKISDLIKARGLSTYVTQHCVSACTIVFLGGTKRYLHAGAKLGFHQPYFRGMTAGEQRISIAREQARLEKFGLSKDFAVRANAAAPSGMWYPEQSELLRELVVTKIVTPQPPKPVASKAPMQSAPATRSIPTLPATPTAYQTAPQ
jgi:hypothetical protein